MRIVNPSAAQIPWDEFRVIKAEMAGAEDASLSSEWKAELDRRMQGIRNGSTKGICHDEVMASVRSRLDQVRQWIRGQSACYDNMNGVNGLDE